MLAHRSCVPAQLYLLALQTQSIIGIRYATVDELVEKPGASSLLSAKQRNGTFDLPADAVLSSCPDECKPVTCGICAHRHCAACRECGACAPAQQQQLKCGSADVCFDPKLDHCSGSYKNDACGGCQMCCAAECSRKEVMYGSDMTCGMPDCRRCSFCPMEETTTTTTVQTTTSQTQECPHTCAEAVSSGWQDWSYVCKSFKAQCWMCEQCSDTGEKDKSEGDVCTAYCKAEDYPDGPKQATICEWSKDRCANCSECNLFKSISRDAKNDGNYLHPSLKVLLALLVASLELCSGSK